jgi:hypothetical protein
MHFLYHYQLVFPDIHFSVVHINTSGSTGFSEAIYIIHFCALVGTVLYTYCEMHSGNNIKFINAQQARIFNI